MLAPEQEQRVIVPQHVVVQSRFGHVVLAWEAEVVGELGLPYCARLPVAYFTHPLLDAGILFLLASRQSVRVSSEA
jgi:hypothetical protein